MIRLLKFTAGFVMFASSARAGVAFGITENAVDEAPLMIVCLASFFAGAMMMGRAVAGWDEECGKGTGTKI